MLIRYAELMKCLSLVSNSQSVIATHNPITPSSTNIVIQSVNKVSGQIVRHMSTDHTCGINNCLVRGLACCNIFGRTSNYKTRPYCNGR